MLMGFTPAKNPEGLGSNAKPAAPAHIWPSQSIAFENLVSETQPKLNELRISRDYAQDLGVDEKALERYVSGACSLYERKEVEAVISQSQWAMSFVSDLVKSRRQI